jgi:hypothetical protein
MANGMRMIQQTHWIHGSTCSTQNSTFNLSCFLCSISAVIKTGEAHGAQHADLYGCLYFYLSDQLRTFVDRLRRFRIKFFIFNEDPKVLACYLRENLLALYGFPAGTKFDRIANLLGGVDRTKIPPIITDWGPMIKENKHATLIASFTEWHNYQKNASVPTPSDETKSECIPKLIADGMVSTEISNLLAVIA